MTVLTDHQRRVAQALLAEEGAEREHVVVTLSGAHAYGFPSPDSDLDLKAIHIAPTRRFLGLQEPESVADVLRTVEGVELDYTSNEVGPVLRGLLGGNGNYLERILGEHVIVASHLLEGLQHVARGAISKRFHRHYRGFAHSQRKAVEETDEPAAKRVLYVLRTALTGAELLRTGHLVVDLRRLLGTYELEAARDLIARKRQGELTRLSAQDKRRWLGAIDRAFEALEAALVTSPLPEEPANEEEAVTWLVDARVAKLGLELGREAL